MIETGRMELDEFQVGHPGTGPVCDRYAVAAGNVWIAGVKVHLAGSSSGQEGGLCKYPVYAACFRIQDIGAETSFVTAVFPAGTLFRGFSRVFKLAQGDEVNNHEVFQDFDLGIFNGIFHQDPFYLASGKISAVHYPSAAVPPFSAELVCLFTALSGEPYTQFFQFMYAFRPLSDNCIYYVFMAEAVTCPYCVVFVEAETVVI